MAKRPIEFGGEERFAASPERVYAQLTDLDAMAALIPDLVSSERVDERTLKCVVRPGFSFIRGTLRMTVALGDCQAPHQAAMNVAGQGIGMSMQVASQLKIEADGDGSRLDWTARVEQLKGLVAAVSPGLISGAADQVIKHTWDKLRASLGEG